MRSDEHFPVAGADPVNPNFMTLRASTRTVTSALLSNRNPLTAAQCFLGVILPAWMH